MDESGGRRQPTEGSLDNSMMTVAEVAEVLRLNVKTVYAECARGALPCRRFGRSIRIPRQVVVSMLQGRVAQEGK